MAAISFHSSILKVFGLVSIAAMLTGCGDATVGQNAAAAYIYGSTSMEEMEINVAEVVFLDEATGEVTSGRFDDQNRINVREPPLSSGKIPRAYVGVCLPYSRDATSSAFRVKELPQRAYCSQVHLYSTYGSETPLEVAYNHIDRWLKELPAPNAYFGTGYAQLKSPYDKMRWLSLDAKIRPYNRLKELNPREENSVEVKIDDYQEFQVVQDRLAQLYYYYDNGADGIRQVRCSQSPQIVPLLYYCTAKVPLNDKLLAELSFIDFRVHGGRPFLRERIRHFKKQFCPIFQCDSKALAAAKVGE